MTSHGVRRQPIVFSGVTEFAAAVGTELGPTDWLVIDQARVDQFAEATDDHQWIHVDPERATKRPAIRETRRPIGSPPCRPLPPRFRRGAAHSQSDRLAVRRRGPRRRDGKRLGYVYVADIVLAARGTTFFSAGPADIGLDCDGGPHLAAAQARGTG
jgi:hypothetical protein